MKTKTKLSALIIAFLSLTLLLPVGCHKDESTQVSPSTSSKVAEMIAKTPTKVTVDENGNLSITTKDGRVLTSKLSGSALRSQLSMVKSVKEDGNTSFSSLASIPRIGARALAVSAVATGETDEGTDPVDDSQSGVSFTATLEATVGSVQGASAVTSYNISLNNYQQIDGDIAVNATLFNKSCYTNGTTITWSFSVNYQYVQNGSNVGSSHGDYSFTKPL